jgi:hypothetical protein
MRRHNGLFRHPRAEGVYYQGVFHNTDFKKPKSVPSIFSFCKLATSIHSAPGHSAGGLQGGQRVPHAAQRHRRLPHHHRRRHRPLQDRAPPRPGSPTPPHPLPGSAPVAAVAPLQPHSTVAATGASRLHFSTVHVPAVLPRRCCSCRCRHCCSRRRHCSRRAADWSCNSRTGPPRRTNHGNRSRPAAVAATAADVAAAAAMPQTLCVLVHVRTRGLAQRQYV